MYDYDYPQLAETMRVEELVASIKGRIEVIKEDRTVLTQEPIYPAPSFLSLPFFPDPYYIDAWVVAYDGDGREIRYLENGRLSAMVWRLRRVSLFKKRFTLKREWLTLDENKLSREALPVLERVNSALSERLGT